MMNQRPNQMKTNQQPIISQSVNPIDEDTKILSNIDCSNELLQFSRPQQAPSYTEQYSKMKTLQKQKEAMAASTLITVTNHNSSKGRKKANNNNTHNTSTDRAALLISTSQDKILSPKTSYNFIQRSSSLNKLNENNKSTEVNYTNYNINHNNNSSINNSRVNTTCVYSSAEGYWQRREMEKKKKMDAIRDSNYQRELNEMRDRPNISKNSQIIASHLRSKSKEQQVFDRLTSGVDVRKKNEDIKNIELRTRENRQPVINQQSQRLQRTIDDLYQWKVKIERKKLENQTVTNSSFDPTPIINNESEDILKERKPDYLRKRVEDRLIEQGEITKIKKEEKKEHYHERLMSPNEEKKCYMVTCPTKTQQQQQQQPNQHQNQYQSQYQQLLQGDYIGRPQQTYGSFNQSSVSTNSLHKNIHALSHDKNYIQKNSKSKSNSITNTDKKNDKRSISGKVRYTNDSESNRNNGSNIKQKNTVHKTNQQQSVISSNAFSANPLPSQSNKVYDYSRPNPVITHHDNNANLSYDIGCNNNRMPQQYQQPSPISKTNIVNTNNTNQPCVNNNNNLVEIRKHLNDYYEQKAQNVNKSFSYNNTNNQKRMLQNVNTPSKAFQKPNQPQTQLQPQGVNRNINSNSNENNNYNAPVIKKNQFQRQSELEEDKIIIQVPKNEPQVKYQPVSFQEEEQWIPCGKDIQQKQQQQPQFNYINQMNPSIANQQYLSEREPKQIDYYYPSYNNNNNCNQNQYQNSLSSQSNSLLRQSNQMNTNTNNDLLPQRYNFNQEIFDRFSNQNQQTKDRIQDKPKQLPIKESNYPQQQYQPQTNNPRQYFTLSSEIDSDIPSYRYQESQCQSQSPSQYIQQSSNMPSASKYQDDNPLSKYREETNKRLMDLEQMQRFANNLRQSNDDMPYKRNIAGNTKIENRSNAKVEVVPQSQISNRGQEINAIGNANEYNRVDNTMAYLNDRLKLNEQSKNYLYEKMNQISVYPDNIALQGNKNCNTNTNNYYQNNNRNNINNNINSDSNNNLNVNTFEFQRKKI